MGSTSESGEEVFQSRTATVRKFGSRLGAGTEGSIRSVPAAYTRTRQHGHRACPPARLLLAHIVLESTLSCNGVGIA